MEMAENLSQNRYLVLARVGDGSLHQEWIRPAEHRNFDLCLSYYGGKQGRYAGDCEIYTEAKGAKWPKIYDLIKKMGDRIFQYDAVWFPDDDILTYPGNISRMFELFSEYGLMLAQPALTANHYFQVTAQHIDYKLRYTHFVEIMVPIFSRDALRVCWPTFNKSVTGWGMEHVWAKLLGYPETGMAILDETPVKHTRPPGQGELYENIKKMKIDVMDPKYQDVWGEYGITFPFPSEISYYGGIKVWDPASGIHDSPEETVRQNQTVSKVRKTVKKWKKKQARGKVSVRRGIKTGKNRRTEAVSTKLRRNNRIPPPLSTIRKRSRRPALLRTRLKKTISR